MDAFACKKFFSLSFTLSSLLILGALQLIAAPTASAKTCFQEFAEAGAMPSTKPTANFQCRLTAAAAGFSMETYYCGGGTWIERYCGTPAKAIGCPASKGAASSLVGNPCDAATGNKLQIETDSDAVGTSPLYLRRVYNSNDMAQYSERWGARWQGRFDSRVTLYGASTVLVTRADGKGLFFTLTNGSWIADADVTEKLFRTASGWTLTTNDQSIETYDTSGALLSITDRNNRVQQFIYSDGTTGANGGYTLDASGNPTSTALPPGLLIRVTDDTGRSLDFGYDSNKRTVKAIDPAGGIYHYTYDANNNLASVTYPDAKKRTYIYGETANTSGVIQPNALTGIIDEANQRYATFQYNADGLAISTEHAGGAQKVTLAYTTDGSGLITAAATTDARNTQRQLAFTKVAGGIRTQSVTQPCGNTSGGSCSATVLFTYDTNGNVASKTGFNGKTTTYSYDLTRNLETSRTEASGTAQARTITTTWHLSYRLPTQVNEPGRCTDLTYEASGNLLSKTIADTALNTSRTWTYTYNNLGQMLTTDGPRTDVPDITTYTYYAQTSAGNYAMGDLASVTNAQGHVTSITKYDTNGRPLSITDPNGVVTTLTYSPRGWLTSRTLNGLQVTTYEYDSVGQLIKATQPDGSYLNYTYDAAHRLTDIADASGNRIHYTLDAMGNRSKEDVVDPSGALKKTQSRVYDALNRLQQEIGGSNPSAQITQYTYDNNGNLTSTTDALDRLVQITDPASGIAKQGYDALDQQTSVTDPRNVVTTYVKNVLGDVTQTQSPDSGTSNAVYDAAGNIAQKTDARGIVANYSYDVLNRLASITYPANPAENVSFTYDSTANGNKGVGRLTGYSNDGGATVLVYDAYGNVVQQTDSIGSQIYTTDYQYDSANRVSQIAYPSGRIVYYVRNTLGQITQVQTRNDGSSSLVTLVSAAAYEPFGPLNSLSFGNGVGTMLQHDADYRVARVTTTSTPLWDFVYSYDLASNLSAQADQASTYSRSFSYDALYRVITDVNNTGSWSYAYDATGNRTKRINTSTQNLTYATTSNRLAKVGSTTQARDAAGNLITFGTKTYTYNHANRLSTYAVSGATKAQMQYNALGQRVAKLQISKPLHMHYDRAGRYLGTTAFNTDGSMYQRYEWIYLDDLPVAQVRTNYNASTGAVSSRRRLYIHGDHLNTPRTMTDSARTMVWRWDGDAFGQTKPNQNPDGNSTSDALNLRFPGQYADAETGLYYNYYRNYDPAIGRYIESDPIGLEGGLNTYAYVGGNPISLIDPFGLETCLLTTVGPLGIRDHAAVYTSRGDGNGGAAIYDPAGSYSAAHGGGSGDVITGPDASVANYKNYHGKQDTESTCVDTSKKEEEAIINNATNLPSAPPFQCAARVSSAVSGQPSFPNVKPGTFWPGDVRRQFK